MFIEANMYSYPFFQQQKDQEQDKMSFLITSIQHGQCKKTRKRSKIIQIRKKSHCLHSLKI